MAHAELLNPAVMCHIHTAGLAETVGQVGHLPYHFLVVHTGYDVAMTFIRDSEAG